VRVGLRAGRAVTLRPLLIAVLASQPSLLTHMVCHKYFGAAICPACQLHNFTTKPRLAGLSAAAEGWVSGYIVAPPQCGAGISARACQRCLASKAPQPCLACAKSPQLKARMLDTVFGGIDTLSPVDGCGTCYKSTAPDTCTACLFGKKPCAECALQSENLMNPAARMDVAACISCR
jgi:hypothetical protein